MWRWVSFLGIKRRGGRPTATYASSRTFFACTSSRKQANDRCKASYTLIGVELDFPHRLKTRGAALKHAYALYCQPYTSECCVLGWCTIHTLVHQRPLILHFDPQDLTLCGCFLSWNKGFPAEQPSVYSLVGFGT